MPAADCATAATWRCAARALGLPLWVLRLLPLSVLRRLLHLIKGRAEARWFRLQRAAERLDLERRRASLDIDIAVGALDAIAEGKLP